MLKMVFWTVFAISLILSFIVCDDVINGERFLSKQTVMAVFTQSAKTPGPCKYLPAATRQQKHQCRKDYGLAEAIKEARRLAITSCEEQFRYDRWNCSVETRGKRNIFKKLYRETAFVHALTAAAFSYSVARACAEGRMRKCSCGLRGAQNPDATTQSWRWGGCNDNLRYGNRQTRIFLELKPSDGDQVTEMLRHDSEVGIHTVSASMQDKCKCHGMSGSCSMKTCWKKLVNFNETASALRLKYHQAVRKQPSNKASRRAAPNIIKKSKKVKSSQYSSLLYMETSPTFCSVSRGRVCLNPESCATLCCGRGYNTRVFRVHDKCRCRFKDGVCCQVICDYCHRYEERYYCK